MYFIIRNINIIENKFYIVMYLILLNLRLLWIKYFKIIKIYELDIFNYKYKSDFFWKFFKFRNILKILKNN